jgi:c-di-GMP-binding flagellar brake protein YcgR
VRFLPLASTPGAIAASVEEGRAGEIESLVEAAATVRVTIKMRWAAIAFSTVLLTQTRRLLARQVTMRMPRKVDVEQRRRAPRERVPQEVQVQARLLQGGTDVAAAQSPVSADVWDLSSTGVCVCCRADQLPKNLKPGYLMSLTLLYNGSQHVLSARFRHHQTLPNGGIRLGLEFDPPPSETANVAAAGSLQALIDLLAQIRVQRTSEESIKRTLGLTG